jgi:hypothetical protein
MGVRQFSFAAQSVSSAAFPLLAPAGTAGAPSFSFAAHSNSGIYDGGTGALVFSIVGTPEVTIQTDLVQFQSDNASISMGAAADVRLWRDAAAVLALKNGATVQTLRVYSSTTSSKYASLTHTGSVAVLSDTTSGVRIGATSGNVGFYGTAPVALQTGVAATATAVRAVLINLGLCT